MRNLILFLCTLPLFAAQNTTFGQVQCDPSAVSGVPALSCPTGVYVITATFEASASTGAVLTAVLPVSGPTIQSTLGTYIYQIETTPGSTAPTDNWDLAITDAAGRDVMGAGCINRDTANSEVCVAGTVNPVIAGPLTLTITGNSVNSATGTVKIYLNGAALRASAGGAGTITEIDGATGVTVTNGTGPVVTVALDNPVTVPHGGTGAVTNTNHGVLLGKGASAIAATAAGTSGQCLQGSTGADPSFTDCVFLGLALTRTSGTTATIDAGSFGIGNQPLTDITAIAITQETRAITAIADLGGSPKQTRLTFASALATTVLQLADNLSINGATGAGTSGLNNVFTIQARSDTTHADIVLDSTGMTYTASSATAGSNPSASGQIYAAGGTSSAVEIQVPSASGLIYSATGGPVLINQVPSPTYGPYPIGLLSIVAGALSTATNARGPRGFAVTAGNLGIVVNAGVSGYAVSTTADVMCKSCSNVVTGSISAKDASFTAPFQIGTADPASSISANRPFFYNTTTGTLKVSNTDNTWTAVGSGVVPSVRVAYSSDPTCDSTIAGQMIYYTDGVGIYKQCNGTSSAAFYNGMPVTLPGVVAGWTALNTPSTSADRAGGINIVASGNATENVRGILKAKPSASFTMIFAYVDNSSGFDFNVCGGIVTSGTATSAAVQLLGRDSLATGTLNRVIAAGWSAATSGTPTYAVLNGTNIPGLMWGKMVIANGGTWTYSISADGGQSWTQVYSVSEPFTSSHYGFGCNSRGTGGAASATLISMTAN